MSTEQLAFVQGWDEFSAHFRRCPQADTHDEYGEECCRPSPSDGCVQQRSVKSFRCSHKKVLFLRDLARHEDRHSGRDEGQRQKCGRSKRHQDSDCHRKEHLPFSSGQGEHR